MHHIYQVALQESSTAATEQMGSGDPALGWARSRLRRLRPGPTTEQPLSSVEITQSSISHHQSTYRGRAEKMNKNRGKCKWEIRTKQSSITQGCPPLNQLPETEMENDGVVACGFLSQRKRENVRNSLGSEGPFPEQKACVDCFFVLSSRTQLRFAIGEGEIGLDCRCSLPVAAHCHCCCSLLSHLLLLTTQGLARVAAALLQLLLIDDSFPWKTILWWDHSLELFSWDTYDLLFDGYVLRNYCNAVRTYSFAVKNDSSRKNFVFWLLPVLPLPFWKSVFLLVLENALRDELLATTFCAEAPAIVDLYGVEDVAQGTCC
ncbi:hypothetical protein SLEP1_g8182 [Rubroshorea leprosula]|uniref:Uncharacterized protein n=1 Tax=Rubroshorea leprosula TaxID=152421 RepID=A0AAV5I5D7_9ROSI|nr:hypothetical protein SLEP1_g8182 [Rubroshorea leprosula]